MDAMDFMPVYKGVYNLIVSLGIATTAFTPSPSPINTVAIQTPEIIETAIPQKESEALTFDQVIIGPIQPQTVIQPEINPKEYKLKSDVTPSVSPSPTPTPTPTPSSSPVPLEIPQTGNSQKLFDMVNDYRKGKGLPIFEKEEKICKIAEERAPQVNGELSSSTLHKGFKDLNLSYWATENIAAYSSIEQDLKFWLSDYIHKKAIESDAKFSCVSCEEASCSQIFTSFVQK